MTSLKTSIVGRLDQEVCYNTVGLLDQDVCYIIEGQLDQPLESPDSSAENPSH